MEVWVFQLEDNKNMRADSNRHVGNDDDGSAGRFPMASLVAEAVVEFVDIAVRKTDQGWIGRADRSGKEELRS